MSQTLKRDAVFAALDLKTERIDVPEWGGTLLMRGMTGAQRDSFDQSSVSIGVEHGLENFRARLLVACAVDEQGAALFSEADIATLSAKSGAVLDRLARIARRLSGLGAEEEAAAKNASAVVSGGSGSV
jgi:hypothetical protein